MNKSFRLLLLIGTVLLLLGSCEVECRRTYNSRSSSSGRGNRGKNQPSNGGLFSSWFGGSKSSSSGSGSVSKPSSSSTSAKKNWQTASSQASGQSSKSGWANPYYKPTGSAVPSAPKEPNYGWKSASATNSKVGGSSSLPSSNIGPKGYPVQSGVQQSNYGFKPSASGTHTATNYQPSQSGFGSHQSGTGGIHAPPSAPNTGYKPANAYQTSHGYPPSYNAPHQSSYGGAHPPSYNAPSYGGAHPPSYNAPSYGGAHPPSYHAPSYGAPHPPSYHSSGSHHPYPQQPSYSGYSNVPSFSGHSPHTSYSSPTFSSKLLGGSSSSYAYPGSGNWGITNYGAKRSSGTGKLLTGLAVGAAGGYLTSSLVNRISNPWRYSGYGYGSGFGYGPSLGLTSSYLSRDESAFERGYERGVRDRMENSKDKAAPAQPAPAPEPEDPTKNWINCVAFDPQTQQTLINPNCSCTVTTSQDERTGQPLSVHHCTTLNGLVLKPIPVNPQQEISPNTNQAVNAEVPIGVNQGNPGVNQGGNLGINQGSNQGVSNEGSRGPRQVFEVDGIPISFGAYGPPPGFDLEPINTPVAPAYGSSQYGGPSVYSQPNSKQEETSSLVKTEGSIVEAVSEKGATEGSTTETKTEESTTTMEGSSTAGTVIQMEKLAMSSLGGSQSESGQSSALSGGHREKNKSTEEFYGQLQKIVNMGNFVGGG